ncbi:hypothetical protein ABZ958_07620 [Streptomyces sp. NPDC046237]|uniref:hypothetical protein n=1 Tax=Streptomyces sp. NPDC046237 TaxID=3154914 RepID=UPI0033C9880D
MNTKRRATTRVLPGLLQGTVGTVTDSKDFGAPLCWSATFSCAFGWFAERRATTS